MHRRPEPPEPCTPSAPSTAPDRARAPAPDRCCARRARGRCAPRRTAPPAAPTAVDGRQPRQQPAQHETAEHDLLHDRRGDHGEHEHRDDVAAVVAQLADRSRCCSGTGCREHAPRSPPPPARPGTPATSAAPSRGRRQRTVQAHVGAGRRSPTAGSHSARTPAAGRTRAPRRCTTYTATGHRWSASARRMKRLHTSGTAIDTSAPTATTNGSVGCGSHRRGAARPRAGPSSPVPVAKQRGSSTGIAGTTRAVRRRASTTLGLALMHELSNLSMWHATMSDEEWGPAARRSVAISTSTSPSSAPATRACGPPTTSCNANPRCGRRARGERGRVRRQRPQRRLVFGAAADGSRRGRRRVVARRGGTTAAGHARHGRRGGPRGAAEGIECDFQRGGYVQPGAQRGATRARARASSTTSTSYGFTDDEYRLLDADAAQLCGASKVVGGTFTPYCAAIHPARLARGLAERSSGLQRRQLQRRARRLHRPDLGPAPAAARRRRDGRAGCRRPAAVRLPARRAVRHHAGRARPRRRPAGRAGPDVVPGLAGAVDAETDDARRRSTPGWQRSLRGSAHEGHDPSNPRPIPSGSPSNAGRARAATAAADPYQQPTSPTAAASRTGSRPYGQPAYQAAARTGTA